MKKKFLAVFAALFVFGSVGAFAFDWSQCWCNYGGGIESGDLIMHVDAGLGTWLIDYFDYNESWYTDRWFIPYTEVSLSYAGHIWKLPFTFGGYVGFDGHGFKYHDYWDGSRYIDKTYSYMTLHTGGDIAYHVQLPPEKLDVYTGTKIGAAIHLGDYSGSKVDLEWDGYLGANWFFSDFFGVNLEVGGPGVYLKTGFSFKF